MFQSCQDVFVRISIIYALFLWAFGHMWKEKKTIMSIFIGLQKGQLLYFAQKKHWGSYREWGALKWMKMLLAEILDLVFFSS